MRSFQLFCALLLGLVAGAFSPVRAQRFEWAQSIRQPLGFDSVRYWMPPLESRSATNSAGTTAVIGSFCDTLRITGGATLSGGGATNPDVFVAVFSADGQLQWLRRLGSNDRDVAHSVAIDASGNVFITVSHWATLVADTVTVAGLGTTLVKYTAAGTVQWARQLSNRLTLYHRFNVVGGLVTNAAGDCFLAGRANFQLTIAGFPTNPATPSIGYLLRLNGQTGTPVWFRQIPMVSRWQDSTGFAYQINSLVLDGRDNLLFAGCFSDTLAFETGAGTGPVRLRATQQGSPAFVASYTASGRLRWARATTIPSGYAEHLFYDAAADAAGQSYLVGSSQYPWQFDTLSLPAGSALFCLDSAGVLMWGRPQPVNGHTLALTPRGDILQAGIFRGTVTLGPNTLTAQGSGDGFVASFNGQTGLPQWAVAVGGTGQELLKDISVGPNATAYVYGHSGEASAAPSSFPLGAAVVLGPGTFLARMSLNANRLLGEVYLDGNGNGTRDTGEIAFPRPVLVESALHSATSDPATGRFTVFADTGYYDLRLPQAPPRFTVQEGASGYQGSFTAYGQSATNLNFGLAAIVNQQDLRVTLSPYSPARPGQVTRYRARLENVGTTVVASGEVAATLDAAAIIIGTVPVASQSQGQTRIWAFTNLPPFAVRDYDITFSLPVTTPPGTILVSTATATAAGGTDVNSADNTDVLQHTVTASFDPNDISVNYTQLTLAQVAAGEKLDYLIRFENLGTDTAFAVTVVDSLPGDFLQLGTVQLVGTSHNVQWSLADGVLTLRFPGIRLPQQAVDALRSKGFVRFRVKPRPTLLDGTLIPGRAHITFDFNAPITTNLVTTLVGGFVTGAPDALSGAADWTLYPNPATATVTLTADAARAGRATVRLLDAVGRTVRTCELAVTPGPARLPLDVRGLPAGVYAVHLALPGVPPTARRLLVR